MAGYLWIILVQGDEPTIYEVMNLCPPGAIRHLATAGVQTHVVHNVPCHKLSLGALLQGGWGGGGLPSPIILVRPV